MPVLTEISRSADPDRRAPRMAFGEVTVDVESRRVQAPAGATDLEPRAFDLLLTLAERPGLTVARDHLLETVWGANDGSGAALNLAVTQLRTALGDDAQAPRFIETVPWIGYRWIYQAPLKGSRWDLGQVWAAAGAMLGIAIGEPRSFVER